MAVELPMKKYKSEQVSTRLEEIIVVAMDRAIGNGKRSEYIRSLIIKDLREKGLLTDAMLVALVS